MVQPLKHYALRLWATLLVGGPAILWVLPATGAGLVPSLTVPLSVALLLAIFAVLGALFNLAGTRNLKGHMRAAEDWERDGSTAEAEASYQRALAAFDSFLLSPRARRRLSPKLSDHLARFYKVRTGQSVVSEAFIGSYLRLHPEDEDLARIWLRQAGSRGWLERKDQELAARIGAALPDSPAIQELLTRYCLMEERTDFSAMETYRRLMTAAGAQAPADLVSRLADLFLEQGRADEWALPVYVRAFEQAPERPAFAAGIAVSLKDLAETRKNRQWMAAGQRLLKDVDPARIEKELDRFVDLSPAQAGPFADEVKKKRAADRLKGAVQAAVSGAGMISAAFSAAGRRLAAAFRWAKKSPSARRSFRWTALLVAAAAAVVLVVNTAGYLVRSEKRPDPPAPAVRPTGRFTIQVAAYLKEEHASRYAKELKRSGLDVYWTESRGDRKKWYQVRISRFKDKAAARAYGDTLKAKGLIEDYYIANYRPASKSPAAGALP
jgi:hypothetical protein